MRESRSSSVENQQGLWRKVNSATTILLFCLDFCFGVLAWQKEEEKEEEEKSKFQSALVSNRLNRQRRTKEDFFFAKKECRV